MKDPSINTDCLPLLDQIPFGLILLQKDLSIRFWNKILVDWTGIKKEDIIGKNLLDQYPQLNQPSVVARFPEVFNSRTPVFFSSHFHPNLILSVLPDGTHRIQKGSVIPINFNDEIHAIFIIEDVTDLVRQVTAYRKMRDIARQELAERKKAEDSLQIANTKLSLFSDITLLDIKNQIAIAMGLVSLVEKDFNNQEGIRSTTTRINEQLGNMEKSIDLMREYEKLGMNPPLWYSVDKTILHASLITQSFRIETDPKIEGLEIFCAPLFEHILANLFENAEEYGKPGSRVKISFQEDQESGILAIESSGAGVARDRKKAIFMKGYGKKTRFGLYVSREILAMTGITMDETGEEGKGTRFEITIPKDRYRFASASTSKTAEKQDYHLFHSQKK
jgi:signal transduction histidine kinase